MSGSRYPRRPDDCLIGRADLLRVLSGLDVVPVDSSDHELSDVLGFGVSPLARDAKADKSLLLTEPSRYSSTVSDEAEPSDAAEDIGIWVCSSFSSCQPLTDRPAQQPVESTANEPEWQRERKPAPARIQHLTFSGLLNTWDQIGTDSLPGQQLDVHKAVNLCAQAKPLLELPLRKRRSLPGEVVLIIDCHTRLLTLLNEQILIIQHLHQILGKSLHVVEMREPPERLLDDIRGLQSEHGKAMPVTAAVVVFSDFGAFSHNAGSVDNAGWRRLLSHFLDRGNPVITLGAGAVPIDHRGRHIGLLGDSPADEVVNQVMASMVRLHLARPDRIRSMIKALGISSKVALAAENAVWNHPDRDSQLPNQWSFRPGRRAYWRSAYGMLPVVIKEIIDDEVERWRSSLHLGHAGVEYLIDGWAGIGDGPSGAIFDRAMAERSISDQGQGRFDSWLFAIHSVMQEVAEVYAERDDLKPLMTAVQSHAAKYKLSQPLGLKLLNLQESARICFYQIGQGLQVMNKSVMPSAWSTGSLCLYQNSQKQVRHGDRLTGHEVRLQSTTHEVCLTLLTRPSWAKSIARDSSGNVRASHEDDVVFGYEPASERRPAGGWSLVGDSWSWARAVGVDDYGLWAEFTVKSVSQRLRWISPGEFQMGAPEDEPQRCENETLHRVTLTEGYWLAETACTQAMWKAVMGGSPSSFKGPDRPVETVSWHDVKKFIKQLNKRVPDLQIKLPTEAQWEYAARAGSQDAFWWGSTLSPEQANYDGNHPYADGEKGQYRQETMPVNEFEANPWGLYQVHGNVLEWCEDWYGDHESEAVEDPRGAESGEGRVCRGGSWGSNGRELRAAYRFDLQPDYRSYNLSFRLCAGQSGAEPL